MLFSALIFGLISSLHCIGMCGPIALMLPVDHHNQTKKTVQICTYHLGRISAYATIGLVFGIMGKAFSMAGFQQKISIVAGIAMIVIILIPERKFAEYNFSKPMFRVISKIKTSLGAQFKNRSFKSLFTIGLLNGFLPCGMVYVALFGAIAMQDVGKGIAFMVLFGLGTVPMMSIVVLIQSVITVSFRNKVRKAIPFATVAIGILFIMRGLELDIPYISPSATSLYIQDAPNCK